MSEPPATTMGSPDGATEPAGRKSTRPAGVLLGIVLGLSLILVPAALYGMVRLVFLESYSIQSAAMEPALHSGEHVIADSWPLHVRRRSPRRGEIVAFRYPEKPDSLYLKRIAALPGETIAIRAGEILIDGEAIPWPYTAEPPRVDYEPRTMPEGAYFMLGDNINRSSDSRIQGTVPRENLAAIYLFKY